jgi:2-dehydro-3-deoxyphosphogluconate aldolase / (4S)-4-hydroxy-2-oxoglutarate aldolase
MAMLIARMEASPKTPVTRRGFSTNRQGERILQTLNRIESAAALREAGIMASFGIRDQRRLVQAAAALCDGGLRAVELTYFAVRGNSWLIPTLKEMDLLVGVGSITRSSQVREADVIGADFVASPVNAPDVVLACEEADVPCILGGLSPTEIWRAHEMQPDFVKVTDPEALGGPPYAGSLREPLPTLHLVGGNMPLHGYLSYLDEGVEVLEFVVALLMQEPTSRDEWVELSRQASEIVTACESWKASHSKDIGPVRGRTAQADDRERALPGSGDSSAPSDAPSDSALGSHGRYLKSPRGAG